MQQTLTIQGKRFTAKQIKSIIQNDEVILNGVPFHVTYRVDEHNMFERPQMQDANYMLLWGRGYKYAFCLPLRPQMQRR